MFTNMYKKNISSSFLTFLKFQFLYFLIDVNFFVCNIIIRNNKEKQIIS